jgi:hypothetical protein
MTASGLRQNRAARRGDRLWAILACGGFGLCLAVGAVAQTPFGAHWGGGGTKIGTAEPPRTGNAPRDPVITEAEMRSGSILFVPFSGDQCQHNLFDNISGQIWHSGYVSCDVALQRGNDEKTKGWSIARTEAIRGSFRWKAPAE